MGARRSLPCSGNGTKQTTCQRPVSGRYIVAPVTRRRLQRTTEDIREFPCYSYAEVALYLGIPHRTLVNWVSGFTSIDKRTGEQKRHTPLIKPADPLSNLLSFYNLVEAHILTATKRRKIPAARVRNAVEWANAALPGPHPLATYEFATHAKDIFVMKVAGSQTVNASRYGQIAFGRILNKYLKTIKRNPEDNSPIEVQPFRRGERGHRLMPSPVVINPLISSGKPVIEGTGIVASIVKKRADAGERLSDLALDYGVPVEEIKKVVNYLRAA